MGDVIELDLSRVRVLLRRVQGSARDPEPLMADVAERLVDSVKQTFLEGGRPRPWRKSQRVEGMERGKTLIQSARLMNSIHGRSSRTEARVGTRVAYARIHHEGGVIKPRKARALAIPLQSWIKAGPRHYDDLGYVRPEDQTKDNKGLLVRYVKRMTGRGRKRRQVEEMIPMFALRGRVEIPARPFMMAQEEDAAYIRRRLEEWLTTGRLA